jgi:hypothetical protein
MAAILGVLGRLRSRLTNTLVMALLTLVGSLCASPVLAAAQGADTTTRGSVVRRWEAGGGLVYAQSVGDLRRNVQGGVGVGGQALLHLDPWGVLSARADVEMLGYSRETRDAPLYGVGGWYSAELQTSYNLLVASLGPELAVPFGPARPYVNASIGFVSFSTSTTLKAYDGTSLGQWEDFSDYARLQRLGGGIRIPVRTSNMEQSLMVDIGARYNAGGRARYLIKGDIIEDPNNARRLIITPHESEARFWTYRLGVAFAF